MARKEHPISGNRDKFDKEVQFEEILIILRRNNRRAFLYGALAGTAAWTLATVASVIWVLPRLANGVDRRKKPTEVEQRTTFGQSTTFPSGVITNLSEGMEITVKPSTCEKLAHHPDAGINLPPNHIGAILLVNQISYQDHPDKPRVAAEQHLDELRTAFLEYRKDQKPQPGTASDFFANTIPVATSILQIAQSMQFRSTDHLLKSASIQLSINWLEAMIEGLAWKQKRTWKKGVSQKQINLLVQDPPIQILKLPQVLTDVL